MARPKVSERSDDILDAALRLLRTGGLASVTTNALAAEARCSKDTLYALFADRDAILAALISRQAAQLNARLDSHAGAETPRARLVEAGAQLVSLLLSDASLAINRAALADTSGELSRILIASGKVRSAPSITGLIEQLAAAGVIEVGDAGEAYRSFYGLLIGDRQILALHGVHAANLSEAECLRIAETAVDGLFRLYAPRSLQATGTP